MALSNIAELVEELGARQLRTPAQLAPVQRDEADLASARALCRVLAPLAPFCPAGRPT
jgi:hypothetical protein